MTAIATGWRGTMQDSEDKQTCPFCGADWGHCDHYNLLVEWESYAEKVEHKAKPAPPRTKALLAAIRQKEQQEYR